jgi:hypothetical protein
MSYGRLLVASLLTLVVSSRVLGGEIAGSREIAKSPDRLETTRSRPKAYGIQDYTITVVPAIAFLPASEGQTYFTSGSLGRFGPTSTVVNFYASIDLPAGAVVDYIGLNSLTDAPNAIGVAMYQRFENGFLDTLAELGSTAHDWGTDYNSSPLDRPITVVNLPKIIHVQQGNFPTQQFFGHVEVWWRREVFDPFTVSFNDVPADHPFRQFIGALAASGITVGCGNGNFCPNDPLTRGQMAVFLAKALGLHWGWPAEP